MKNLERKAIIYCRVSSKRQKAEGHGLVSQETVCRVYADNKGYTVAGVFQDDLTGAIFDRPGIHEMLAFLRAHRKIAPIVIIDDISRLARDFRTHFDLRDAITSAGGILESPNFVFASDPDSELHELLSAGFSHHQRRKNAEQVKSRMRARVMNGYYVFKRPVGYNYAAVRGQGKMLVRDEPIASVIQEALESYASGRFQILAEIQRFLEAHPSFPRGKDGKVHSTRINELLTRPVYAGYVEAPDWGISLRKGLHEPLISFETYKRIQLRLEQQCKAPARCDIRFDFPLRGAVCCDDCNQPLTASWSTGRSSRYAYYLCSHKGCASYGKSIRREIIEGEFEQLLKNMQPTPALFRVAVVMFEKLWNQMSERQVTTAKALAIERAKAEKQIEALLERILTAETSLVISSYEKRIQSLEEQKLLLDEKIENCGRPRCSFESSLRTALEFLANPWKLWTSGRFEDKRIVLKLAFADRLIYARSEGFRTAVPSLPFKYLADFSRGDLEMVDLSGIEPLTSTMPL